MTIQTLIQENAELRAEVSAKRFLAREWQDKAEEYRAERDELRERYADREVTVVKLLAERDRYREALTEIRDGPEWRHGHPVDIARDALESEET